MQEFLSFQFWYLLLDLRFTSLPKDSLILLWKQAPQLILDCKNETSGNGKKPIGSSTYLKKNRKGQTEKPCVSKILPKLSNFLNVPIDQLSKIQQVLYVQPKMLFVDNNF